VSPSQNTALVQTAYAAFLRSYEARLFFGDGVVRESRAAWEANSFQNEFDMTS
jgi:hypothetical protein